MKLLSNGFSFFLFILFFSFSPTVFAATPIGQMVWVQGNVQVIDANNHSQTLQRRSPVYEQDTIITGSGSGQIVFTDNSLVVLREGTTFRIAQYKYHPGSPGNNKYVADMAKGGFRTITGLISKNNPTGYQVNTPVATLGVRGTRYEVVYSNLQGLAVKLESGAMTVSNSQGTARLNAASNQIYAVVKGARSAPSVTPQASPLLRNGPALVPAKISSSSFTSGEGAVSTGGTKNAQGLCIH